jgi:hypothetical protein
MVTERFSPSRVRYAAQNAPLTAPGRSANPPLGRKVVFKEGKIKIYLTQAGILMEGHYAQIPLKPGTPIPTTTNPPGK